MKAALSKSDLDALLEVLPKVVQSAGIRLTGNQQLDNWLRTGPIGRMIALMVGPAARPVRAILLNKTNEANWSLAWHQDRTIAVRERVEIPGFGSWTVKSGVLHVEPPFSLIQSMATVRIHIDAVDEANAPLLVAPGSHRRGRILEANIERIVQECGAFRCFADTGDVWLYSTPILHASEAVRGPRSRSVLQVDFSSEALPGSLQWLGVG